jgi:hypothetical protein
MYQTNPTQTSQNPKGRDAAIQIGFDFGLETGTPLYKEQPPGTWNVKNHTTRQYLDMFAEAKASLPSVLEAVRPIFGAGLAALEAAHARILAGAPRTEPYGIHGVSIPLAAEDAERVMSLCRSFCNNPPSGIESKIRATTRCECGLAAMYAQGIGSIVIRSWPNAGNGMTDYRMEFCFSRHCSLLDSYQDSSPDYPLQCRIWEPAYSGMKISNASRNIASLTTFAFNGREYINSGACYAGKYRECNAWSFCPLESWQGPTYDYVSLCQRWNEGCNERGDMRGLVVGVRGKLCVLDGFARFHDDNAPADSAYFGEVDEIEECGDMDEED